MADETKTGGFYLSSGHFSTGSNVSILEQSVGAISGQNALIQQFQRNFNVLNTTVFESTQVKLFCFF